MEKSLSIYIPNISKQTIGGGWTFRRGLVKALGESCFVSNFKIADLILITGATMTSRDEISEAKKEGKKIVFRVDNIPKDSRNRGTAFSRMLDFVRLSDWIIFQSEWAKDYAGWWFVDNGININNKSNIIYNGIDPEFFFEKEIEDSNRGKRYLFIHFNRDENKRFPEACYLFHQEYRKDKSVELWLVGNFSPELIQYNFDFFAGERVIYLGVVNNMAQMGEFYRSCKYILFPAYADACANTLLEAISCGCEPVGINEVGGSKELLRLKGRTIYEMGDEYKKIFNQLLSK